MVILGGPNEVLQTVYLEDTTFLDTIAIDEDTGKIAVSSGSNVYIYEPFVVGGVPKVRSEASLSGLVLFC